MKMKKTIVIMIILSSIILSLVSFASCGKNDEAADKNFYDTPDVSGGEAENPTEETEADIFAGLEAATYDGRVFNILSRETQTAQFNVEEETGDIINDAIYKRNRTVEERFDTKINVIAVAGEWDTQNTFLNTLKNSIMAGDGAFDLVDGYAAYIGNLIGANLYLNLLDVPHLRLTEPWWSQHAVDELTVNGKLFVVPGDITTNLWETIMTIFFHKGLLQDWEIENPYALVKSGEWTLDKMIEINKGLSVDLDGDGKMGTEDQYGTLFYDDLQFNNFHNAFNIPIMTKDAGGIPKFNLGSPEVFDLSEKMYELAYSTDGMVFNQPIGDQVVKMFSQNQVLFLPCVLQYAEEFRAMESDFGILPYPKISKNQEQYKTSSRDQHTLFGIPIDVKDVNFAGLITEALCVASNKIVIPAYYDTALKSKYSRDDESGEMLDIIRQGLNFDFGIVFSMQVERAGFIIRDCVYYKRSFAAEYEKNIGKFENALEKFLVAFE